MTDVEKITEDKIFDAAVQIFENKGRAGARMQEIADLAGINKAMLHYYFRSKDKLFEAVFTKLAATMFEKLFGCFDNDLPLEQKLELFYHEHISFLQKHPRLPAFIFNEINQNPDRIVRILSLKRILSIKKNIFSQIDEEIQTGNIRNVDKIQLLINIIALSVFPFVASGLIVTLFHQQNIDFDDFIERRKTELAQFIINAVKDK